MSFFFTFIILLYSTKFIITHESTDNKQWNYTVEYEEHLSQIPFVMNKIIGDFVVDKSHSQRAIKSTHRTCFAKIYCCEYTQYAYTRDTHTHAHNHPQQPTTTHTPTCTLYTHTHSQEPTQLFNIL